MTLYQECELKVVEQSNKNNIVFPILVLQIVFIAIAITGVRWLDIEVTFDSSVLLHWTLIGAIFGSITYSIALFFAKSNSKIGTKLRGEFIKYEELFGGLSWTAIATLSLAAGLGEESLFRVFLQGWLAQAFHPWMGIVTAAIAFGAVHATSKLYFGLSFIVGVALGIAYFVTDSIILVVSWHAIYDFISLSVISKRPALLKPFRTSEE